MSSSELTGLDRLEAAVEAQLRFLEEGGRRSAEEFLTEHEHLRDLLAPMLGMDGPDIDPDTPTEIAPTPARVIGDYLLLRELGRGGMGVVYEAEQISLGRRVAVKVLPTGLALNPHARARFEREARLAASIEHPGMTKVITAQVTQDLVFYAMELVEGVGLDRLLGNLRGKPVASLTGAHLRELVEKIMDRPGESGESTPRPAGDGVSSAWRSGWGETAVLLIMQVADALHHAHQQRVVHRDVKPANIVVRPDGTAVLTDFGLAREQKGPALTVTGDFLGTPYYVSPEQVTGGQVPVDYRTDVFSLGVTLYQFLTLRRPFEGETPGEVKARILSKEPPRPRRINPRIPNDLDSIVLKALEKDPDRRYATAKAFAEDLRAVVAGKPVAARPVRMPARVLRWCRRNRLAAAFVTAVTLGLAATGYLATALLDTRAVLADVRFEASLRDGLASARAGDFHRAESLLWDVYRRRPDETVSRWALRELYSRFPCTARWQAHDQPVGHILATPDGSRILTFQASDPRFRVWKRPGERAASWPADSCTGAIAMSDDGRFVAWGAGNGSIVSRHVDGKRERATEPHRLRVIALAYSTDGERLFALREEAGLQGIEVWEADLRKMERVARHLAPVSSFAPVAGGGFISATTKNLWSWSPEDSEIRVIEHELGDRVLRVQIKPTPARDQFFALVDKWKHQQLDLFSRLEDRWRKRKTVNFHARHGAAVVPAGSSTFIFSEEQTLSLIRFTGAGVRDEVVRWASGQPGVPCWISDGPPGGAGAGGKLAMGYTDGTVRLWNLTAAPEMIVLDGVHTIHAVRFHRGERGLAIAVGLADGAGEVLSLALDVAAEARVVGRSKSVATSLAVHPKRSVLAFGTRRDGEDAAVRLIQSGTGGLPSLEPPAADASVSSMQFDSAGTRLAAAHDNGAVSVWRLHSGKIESRLASKGARFTSVLFVGDDVLLAGVEDPQSPHRILRWHLGPEPSPEVVFASKTSGAVRALAGCRDGNDDLFAAAFDDHTARIWRDGTLVHELSDHSHDVRTVAFGRFGEQLLLASGDAGGGIRLWDAGTGKELSVLRLADNHGSVASLQFSPGGDTLAAGVSKHGTAAKSNVVLLWRLDELDALFRGHERYRRSLRDGGRNEGRR